MGATVDRSGEVNELVAAAKACLKKFCDHMTYENRINNLGKDYYPMGCWARLDEAIRAIEDSPK